MSSERTALRVTATRNEVGEAFVVVSSPDEEDGKNEVILVLGEHDARALADLLGKCADVAEAENQKRRKKEAEANQSRYEKAVATKKKNDALIAKWIEAKEKGEELPKLKKPVLQRAEGAWKRMEAERKHAAYLKEKEIVWRDTEREGDKMKHAKCRFCDWKYEPSLKRKYTADEALMRHMRGKHLAAFRGFKQHHKENGCPTCGGDVDVIEYDPDKHLPVEVVCHRCGDCYELHHGMPTESITAERPDE
jgi:rubredoxin